MTMHTNCIVCGVIPATEADQASIDGTGRCTYCDKHNLPIPQFIGMLDREGNELKVGDMLQEKDGTLWEVTWKEGWQAFVLQNDWGNQPIDNYVQKMRRLW